MARTPKARALGVALRQARQDKGILLRELAATIQRDMGVLSRWETGERTPKPEHVAQILTKLDVDADSYDEIMTLAYGTDEAQWFANTWPERRQQMAAYVDWERNASRIVEVAPLLVPGLLQTSDYIRAIMTAAGLPKGEIAARVSARIARKEAITNQNPAELLVLLGQSALNQNIGGRQVTLAQLRYLIDLAARPNIELRIVPDQCGWHPGLEGDFSLIESAVKRAQGRQIAVVGTRESVLMLHRDDDVDAYKRAIDQIVSVSLPPDASVDFVGELHNRMRTMVRPGSA